MAAMRMMTSPLLASTFQAQEIGGERLVGLAQSASRTRPVKKMGLGPVGVDGDRQLVG